MLLNNVRHKGVLVNLEYRDFKEIKILSNFTESVACVLEKHNSNY